MDGSRESWRQLDEFLQGEADAEIRAFLSPVPPGQARVLAIRHGMGDHNTYAGMASLVSEDADLNECGQAQAERVGDLFRASGVIAALTLAVVSPFTRTLQTARLLLGDDIGADTFAEAAAREARAERFGYAPRGATVPGRASPLAVQVQPLCAEDTLAHSHVWRGNRGSTAAELGRRPGFGIFDFSVLGEYCEERRVAAGHPERAGKWWHHGPHPQETEASFRRRMVLLKRWLGDLAADSTEEAPPRVVLVSHGGVMQEAFGFRPNAPNCGFRAYDVARGGWTRRVADGTWLEETDLAEPAFHVLSVVRAAARVEGHHVYDIELYVAGETFTLSARESELREQVHDKVQAGLPAEVYERYRLKGLFPRWAPMGHADPSLYIQDYLSQLAVAMADPAFDLGLACAVDEWLLHGRLDRRRRAEESADLSREQSCRGM